MLVCFVFINHFLYLACVDERVVKLITRIGAPPACPLGSNCTGFDGFGGFGGGVPYGGGCGGFFGNVGGGCSGGGYGGFSDFLGAVTEIPLSAIVSFTHSAI